MKSFFAIFILVVYISIGIFGLWQFSHMAETPMINCPYAENGFSICDNGLDHINNWRQFSNVIFSSIFISAFIILGVILHFFNKHSFLKQKQYFYQWKYYLYNKKLYSCPHRIIKWLALLENSPSFNVV